MSIHHKVGSELVEFASKVSFDDASQTLTINGIQHQVGDVVVGQEGEVPYLTPSDGYKKQTILKSDVYVCEDDEDLEKSMSTSFSLKEVYDTWIKCGHKNDYWYGYTEYPQSSGSLAAWLEYNNANGKKPSSYAELTGTIPSDSSEWSPPSTSLYGALGYPFWTYNSQNQSIMQALNTGDYSFYASPLQYLNYDVTFEIKSYNGDDDILGFVAAMNIDPTTGKPHILCFNRSPNSSNYETLEPAFHWYCQVDSNGNFALPETSAVNMISNVASLSAKFIHTRTDLSMMMTTNTKQWWNTYRVNNYSKYMEDWAQISDYSSPPSQSSVPLPAGCEYAASGYYVVGSSRLRIRREGNRISAWTSEFGSSTLGNLISIDLDNLKDKAGNAITCFNTTTFPAGGQIGFSTLSQPMAFFDIKSAKLPKTVIDTRVNSISVYNPIAEAWTLDTSKLPPEYVGVGRLTRNNATGKTFYVTPNSFIKIGEVAV